MLVANSPAERVSHSDGPRVGHSVRRVGGRKLAPNLYWLCGAARSPHDLDLRRVCGDEEFESCVGAPAISGSFELMAVASTTS